MGVLAPFALSQSAGQNSSPATASSPAVAPSQAEDEVLTLPVFDVTADSAHGYIASESTTGTRIASRIADLPFNVDVVTAPFMKDFAEFNLNDQLGFVSGFSPSEITGQFQLRGFTSPVVMVDGFRRIGLVDVVDIERIEVIKGPAASIYGAIQPGGAVNIETPQPTKTQTGAFGISIGSDNLLMAYCHVAHDCVVGDKIVMSNCATLGGHVELGDWVIMGGLSAVHQHTKVGAHCFIANNAAVTRDVPPYVMAVGQPARPHSINVEGLKRRGFDAAQILNIRRAYRVLYRSRLPLAEALAQLDVAAAGQAEIRPFVDFVKNSSRSIVR